MENEITWRKVSTQSGIPVERLLDSERGSVSGRLRRVAEFSQEQLRRSASLNGATDIVLTFADYLDPINRGAKYFDDLAPSTRSFIAEIERVAGAPVTIVSVGFGAAHIIDRRR